MKITTYECNDCEYTKAFPGKPSQNQALEAIKAEGGRLDNTFHILCPHCGEQLQRFTRDVEEKKEKQYKQKVFYFGMETKDSELSELVEKLIEKLKKRNQFIDGFMEITITNSIYNVAEIIVLDKEEFDEREAEREKMQKALEVVKAFKNIDI